MRILSLLLAFLFHFQAMAANPGWSGQSQTSNLYPSVIQAPNNLITDLGSSKALIENGNSNILTNPSFEHKTLASSAGGGWTCTGLTPTPETTTVYSGKKALKLVASASTFECYQDSTINAAATASTQYLESMRLLTTATGTSLKLCARTNAATSTTNCMDAIGKNLNNGIYNLVKTASTGGTTSNGISIAGVSVTGNIFLDDAKVAPSDVVSESTLTDTISFSPDTGMAYTTNTSPVKISSTLTATNNGLIAQDNTGSSTKFVAKAKIRVTLDWSAIITGSNILEPAKNGVSFGFSGDGPAADWRSISASTTMNPGDYIELKLSGGSVTSGAGGLNIVATALSSNYSSTNADTTWIDCGLTSSSGFNGFGTVSAITSKCKRQGSDLLMSGVFTLTGASAVQARVPLPLWNGVQLATSSSAVPVLVVAEGTIGTNATGKNYVPLLSGASAFFTIGENVVTGSGSLTQVTGSGIFGSCSGCQLSWNVRIPIEGWDQSNVITAKLSGLESCTDSYACTDTYSAFITGVTSTVLKPNVPGWITGCTASADTFTCSLNTSKLNLTDRMNCSATLEGGGRIIAYSPTSSTSQIIFKETTSAGANAIDTGFTVTCQKGADYIGKTAMAVASDQNTKAPGATNVDVFTFHMGTTNKSTVCSASPCSYLNQVGTAVTSVTRSSAGSYLINFAKTYSKVNCVGNARSPTEYLFMDVPPCDSSCSSTNLFAAKATTFAGTDMYGSITCQAVP